MSSVVSIVIRTLNEEKFLDDLLKSITKQNIEGEKEIIIVDSGSTDSTLEIAKKYPCKIVTIDKKDFSFGRSLNYGCREANGDSFVFISAHCVPCNENWLSDIVSPLESDNVALSYGRQIGNHLSKFSEHQVFLKYFPEVLEDQQGDFFCNNANSAIKRSLWEQYKFNEELTGLEDMDWAKFFFDKGFEIRYVPTAMIYHIHEESWKKIKIRYEREAYALKEIMPEIHFNILDLVRSVMRGLMTDFKAGVRKRKLGSKFFEILFFRICQFYGTYRGNHIHRKLSKKKKQKYFYP